MARRAIENSILGNKKKSSKDVENLESYHVDDREKLFREKRVWSFKFTNRMNIL